MNKMKMWALSVCLFGTCVAGQISAQTSKEYNIIPVPEQLTPQQGYFKLTSGMTVYAGKAEKVGKQLVAKLKRATGYDITLADKKKEAAIQFVFNKKIKGDEAYALLCPARR